jgi:hypothetical protein
MNDFPEYPPELRTVPPSDWNLGDRDTNPIGNEDSVEPEIANNDNYATPAPEGVFGNGWTEQIDGDDPEDQATNAVSTTPPPGTLAANIDRLPELSLLEGEGVHATPGESAATNTDVEYKRSKLTVDCAVETYHGDTHRFARLTEPERNELQAEVQRVITDDETLDAFCLLLATHDIGKNDEVRAAVGAGPEVDHDEVYARLVTGPEHVAARRTFIPSFDLLPEGGKGQRLLMGAAALRSNYPQTLQGEAPGATLEDIHNVIDPQVRDIDILKAKFDIFGAAGHVDSEVSLTATSSTFRRMRNLDNALRDPLLDSPEARNNAFLDAEIRDLAGITDVQDPTQLAELRTLARLECQLRIEDAAGFARLQQSFDAQETQVKELLTSELNRPTRATLAYYSPVFIREIASRHGDTFALKYFAHVLQESHIADREAREGNLTGFATVQVEELVHGLRDGSFDPTRQTIRFIPENGALIGRPVEPNLENLDGIREFTGEQVQGKRILLVGEGGGSDGVQAAMLGTLLRDMYGCEVVAVVSVRNEARQVVNTGQQYGEAIREITAHTEPVGSWRFLEKIPTEGSQPSPMFILNSNDPGVIKHDIWTMVDATNADVVIGVDTGGDSLYKEQHASFSAHLPADITPDQDYTVMSGLAGVANARKDITVLSAIVAPGIDSPPYARDMLDSIGAMRIPLSNDAVSTVQRSYREWRMDGSGSEEGRYGKTPLAWLHALQGNTGTQLLPLPLANLTSTTNPWRAFTIITPAMAGIVITSMENHFSATRRPTDPTHPA